MGLNWITSAKNKKATARSQHNKDAAVDLHELASVSRAAHAVGDGAQLVNIVGAHEVEKVVVEGLDADAGATGGVDLLACCRLPVPTRISNQVERHRLPEIASRGSWNLQSHTGARSTAVNRARAHGSCRPLPPAQGTSARTMETACTTLASVEEMGFPLPSPPRSSRLAAVPPPPDRRAPSPSPSRRATYPPPEPLKLPRRPAQPRPSPPTASPSVPAGSEKVRDAEHRLRPLRPCPALLSFARK
nr:uncharacterized protein LOC127303342 [Lolium perenne]